MELEENDKRGIHISNYRVSMQEIIIFALGFIACLAAGSTGSLFPTGEWYMSRISELTPPDGFSQ